MNTYVVCETTAAITTHARRPDAIAPVNLSGYTPNRQPIALCGAKMAWDTRLPLSAVRCAKCRARLTQLAAERKEGK